MDFARACGCAIEQEPDEAETEAARACLERHGILVTPTAVALSEEAQKTLDSSIWNSDFPAQEVFRFDGETAAEAAAAVAGTCTHTWGAGDRGARRRIAGRITRAVDLLDAARLMSSVPDAARRRDIFEAGGPGAGGTWPCPPGREHVRMSSTQWLMATRLRLGIAKRPDHSRTCCLRSEKGDVCGKPLDNNLLHISTCNCGPMRHRPHESAKFALHKALRRTAAQQDLERHVPELYTRDHEAIMDLCVTWPGRPDTFFLDLTVKATSAIKHARKREDAGAARRAGVQLKRTRYGNSVDAIVITHFGRLAEESRDALRRIAEASRLWAPPRLGARPGATASYLQLVVEGAVIRAVADAHLLALGAGGGKAVGWRRASRAGPAASAERRSAEPEADAAWAQLDGDEPANEELEAALAQFEAEELAAELAEVEAAEAAVAAAVAARAAPEDEWEHEGGLDAETER